MKKVLLVAGLIALLAVITQAQKSWIGFTSDSPQQPRVKIEDQNTDRVILDISISGMYVTDITAEGKSFKRLELVEDNTTQEIGKPELPMLNQVIGIPDNKMVKVTVLSKQTTLLDNFIIYPFQTPTTDNIGGQNKPFVMDEKFYDQPHSYPLNQIYIGEPGIMRDVKIAGLHIVPFLYNTATKKLEIITHLKVEVEFYGNDIKLVLNRSKNVSPVFYNMYKSSILNFESLGILNEPEEQ